MTQLKSYVRVDEHGVYRVGDTRVMLDSVVAAFHQGHSPETIQQQYPALNLETVYGSIAYYGGDRRIAKPSAVVARLRALQKAGVS